ncbi:MAG: putative hydrolase of the superfamily [Actinomycetota bacterium]|jgi:putative hydrolase of the HAD superfamily|nr:putative hydrolase of the superfamily [Actinomycetota bacterium]
MAFRAVIFDLGGVVFPSPFEAFDAYDHGNDLKKGTTRSLIRTSSETGAWAALERGELTMDEFVTSLEAEALAAGFRLDARRLMGLIGSSLGPRPEMTRAIERIRASGLRTGALTNNWADEGTRSSPSELRETGLFDVIVESAVEGLRKPDPRIYTLALARLNVLASETVFLDDLGMNLKPARDMGIRTIKVVDPDVALGELETILDLVLR